MAVSSRALWLLRSAASAGQSSGAWRTPARGSLAPGTSPGSAAAWRELRSSEGGHHLFCTAASQNITYKELKKLLHSKSKSNFLIDVREPWEILQCGQIPGSLNIPLGEIDQALQMNSEDFKEKYNQDMPSKSDNLVFCCLGGVRSKKALSTALLLGYESARHYPGGWKEWESYEYPEKKK
ncbi:thiosulfate sulfurtransferase/rhodanese-like domain-containing protein 3 isoform X2 [Sarcophilus harrisii]|uniref:thiosulfate sulfurtransferase/rhodanese-like domain-containing protein 3 isoform X2 n=1 Tax=Sarcophilus harrisii TaxID=9305 RepID=UPI000273B743|nr:thiosulfate sulfurtransferase/rhodanese-like domain-containing protein 3 isoform X2 [Sarcophilus harrisii]